MMMWSGSGMGHLLQVLLSISLSVWNSECHAILPRKYLVDTKQWSILSTSLVYALPFSIVSCLKSSTTITASLSLAHEWSINATNQKMTSWWLTKLS
jgi:hypothetical protein